MLPRVKQVKPLPDHRLELTFSSGEVGLYDCSPLLNFGVFTELRDEAYFRQVHVINGTVAWPHEQDICPDTLYLDSRRAPEFKGMDYGSIAIHSPEKVIASPSTSRPD